MTIVRGWAVSIDRVFLGSLGARIGLLGIGFVTTLTLAKLFGSAAVGQMSLFVALLVVTAQISLFGAQMTVLKLLPALDHVDRKGALGPAFAVTLVLGLSVGVGLSALIGLGYLGSYSQFGAAITLMLPLVVLTNAYRVLTLETLRGLARIRAYNVVSLLVAAAVLVIIVAIFLGGAHSINMPLVIFTAEIFGVTLAGVLVIRAVRHSKFSLRFNRIELSRYLQISSIYFLSSLSVLVGQVDLIVAGYFLPIEDVGVYAIALRLAALVGLALSSANISFAPDVSGIYRNVGLDAAIRSARSQTRMLVPLTVAMGLGIAAVGYPVLGMFGQAFVVGYPVLLILTTAQVVGVMFGPVGIFLSMTVGPRDMVLTTLATLVIGLIASMLLIPSYGIVGAAIANLLALLARGVVATGFVYMRTGTAIHVFHAWREK